MACSCLVSNIGTFQGIRNMLIYFKKRTSSHIRYPLVTEIALLKVYLKRCFKHEELLFLTTTISVR